VLIAEINYGGRVTDDKDIRSIKALLESYFTPSVMGEYKFSPSGIYVSPQKLDLADVRDYINALPLEDEPEVFGLHQNANITFQQKIVR
jgi:dynein heavy chain, axonemal